MDLSPKAEDVILPVFVPGEDGELKMVVGNGQLADDQLTINFGDALPSLALERMIARGEILALTFVLLKQDDTNEETNEEGEN